MLGREGAPATFRFAHVRSVSARSCEPAARPAQALHAGGGHFGRGERAFSGNSRTERPGPRAAFPLPEGRARKRVLPIRDWKADPPATSDLRGPSCGAPGPRPGPVASRRPPSRPGPRLRDGFVLAGGGGAEGGSGRESEVGPAAFLGIRCRHSLPPLLRRGRG